MSAQLFTLPKQVALDTSGDPVSGAKLYTYAAGTTTERATYTTIALDTEHDNPVIADAAGRFDPIFLDNSLSYRVILKDSSDVTIYDEDDINDPPTDDILVSVYGAVGDGVTDDTSALQAAFNAAAVGDTIVFGGELTYAFSSQLTIPDKTLKLRTKGSKFKLTTSIAGNNPAIVFAASGHHDIDRIEVEIPTTVTVDRVLSFLSPGKCGEIKVTSVDQQNNRTDSLDAAVDIRGGDFELGTAYVSNYDNPYQVYNCNRVKIGQLYATSYVRGVHFDTVDVLTVDHIRVDTASANATVDPGHNGVLIEDVQFAKIGKADIGQAGEHGFRFGSGSAASAWIDIGAVHSFECGQCGFKINDTNNAHHISVGRIHAIDNSDTTAASSNEDGVRIERARDVTIGEILVGTQSNPNSGYDGIYLNDVKRLTVGTALVRLPANHGLAMVDTNGELREIIFGRLDVIDADADAININSPTEDLADIHIDNFYARAWAGYAVNITANSSTVGAAQPCSIIGKVYDSDPGTGVQTINTSDTDLRVELQGARQHETATGTFTCSPFTRETRIDSSGGAVTATLPDGTYEGQRKVVTMSDAAASSTLSVTSHETSSPEVFTFAQTTDYLVLEWSESQAFWWTVKNIGAAT